MVVWFFLTDNNTTLTKVVLSCFGVLVGLWQQLSLYMDEICLLLCLSIAIAGFQLNTFDAYYSGSSSVTLCVLEHQFPDIHIKLY